MRRRASSSMSMRSLCFGRKCVDTSADSVVTGLRASRCILTHRPCSLGRRRARGELGPINHAHPLLSDLVEAAASDIKHGPLLGCAGGFGRGCCRCPGWRLKLKLAAASDQGWASGRDERYAAPPSRPRSRRPARGQARRRPLPDRHVPGLSGRARAGSAQAGRGARATTDRSDRP